MLKQCSECHLVKNTDDFYTRKASKDGKQSYCKDCSKKKRKDQLFRNRKPRLKLSDSEKKEKRRISDKNWRINNPGKARARSRRYDQRLKQATPPWLTDDQKKAIDTIYENRPDGYHVDHIVPLKGKNVCGLHVPWNLQYLLAEKNMKKKNKY
jgi:hypothetical protein